MRKPCLITRDVHAAAQNILSVDPAMVDEPDSQDIAYWIVDMHDWRAGWQLVAALREHLSPKVYLRPLVYLNADNSMPEEISKAADGHLPGGLEDNKGLEELASRFEVTNQWIDHLPDAHSAVDTNIAFKVLRLIASRNSEQEPVTTVRRISGYVYPLLEPLFSKRDEGVLEILEFLETQKLITGRFVSKAHFCSSCNSAFINFKEACPQCGADDLSVDELVHHFRCAYMGAMSDFQRGSSMVCPKCDRELHHIGVDYDKPSIMYKCNQCSHGFQDPSIMTTCYNCGRSTEPENQNSRVISAYSISAIGQNAASYGMEALFTKILDSELQLHSFDAFKDFYHIEAARIRRYKKSDSSLVMIALRDIDKLYVRLGGRATEVFGELSTVFRTVLRQSDVITARNESIFFVIMTETSATHAERAVERLREGITGLLANNLDFAPEMSSLIKTVSTDMDLDQTLEAFLKA